MCICLLEKLIFYLEINLHLEIDFKLQQMDLVYFERNV